MVSCMRCCVFNSMRVVNLAVKLCGVGMILYSLWLLKKWDQGVDVLPTTSNLPRPWFIYTCLGVGIAVCLSTLCGHVVSNCINNSVLFVYIVSICSLLLLEVAVVVTIFFKYDWATKIAEYIDEGHEKFKVFVIFHLNMCRLIVITIMVPQVAVIVLAFVLWILGTEQRTHGNYLDIPDFNHSFLVLPYSPKTNGIGQNCGGCEAMGR